MKLIIAKDYYLIGHPYTLWLRGVGGIDIDCFENLSQGIKRKRRLLKDNELLKSIIGNRERDYFESMEMSDYENDYDSDPELDELDEAFDNCGQFWDGGVLRCGHIGSEECDFECPFNKDLGKTMEEIDNEIVSEK